MRSTKSKMKRRLLILLTMVIAIIIIIACVIKNRGGQKLLASEYLRVEPIKCLGSFSSDNKTLYLRVLALKVTAIGGEAHGITINTDGLIIDPELGPIPQIDYLDKNQSKEVVINLRMVQYQWDDHHKGYGPIELMISCQEALPDTIVIYLKTTNITRIP